MNRVLRFSTKAAGFYVGSDFHLGHKRDFIWRERGYASSEEHDTGVIDGINAVVKPTDVLVFCGDYCLNTTEEQFEDYISRINCQQIYMLWGNHNNPLERIYKREAFKMLGVNDLEVYPLVYKNVIFVGNHLEVIVDGQMMHMYHYPVEGWNHQRDGAWMIHGHEHGKLESSLPEKIEGGKRLDVGWDIYRKPLSFLDLKQLMELRAITTVGHHEKAQNLT